MSPAPRFRLDRELGSGTTGRVWHGVLTEGFGPYPAGQSVAVKYMHAALEADPQACAAFQGEADAGQAVMHPGVVRVLHSGRDEKGRFLVMTFVPGRNLREVERESGLLPEPIVRSIARQISAGLAALHAAGYVHCDIKPENIRLDAEGNAVLLDLGFARHIPDGDERAERDSHASGARPARGSLSYLAPEQALGETATRASDVFAVGVVMYEMATGLHPFAGFANAPSDRKLASRHGLARSHPLLESASSTSHIARAALEKPDADKLLAAIATARFVSPSRFVPQLSPFLDRLLQDILQRDPARRPDAEELHNRLSAQESGSWWRAQLQFEAGARRGGTGEPDAQHLTPLVGREREFEALMAAYVADVQPPVHDASQARGTSRGGGAVWISGAPGSGKSRLVNEFAARARTRDNPPLYLYGRCRELDEERPCQPVLRLLERWLRLPSGTGLKERERELLAKLVPPRVAITLEQALDPDFEGSSPLALPVALSSWLALLGHQIPLIIFLDDLNFADEGTLAVLALVAEKLRGSGMLLILGLRESVPARRAEALKTLRERLAAHVGVREITLAPLDEEAVLALVRQLFHHSAPRLRLATVLWQRSRGNPGLISEIVRNLIARGGARASDDGAGLLLEISPDDLPLPGSLQKAIGESYKQLPSGDRSWLRRLAVVGGRIETDFLLRAFRDAKRADVDAMLLRLVRSGWLVPVGGRYRFTRPALRESVYRSLSREQRQPLHAAAAAALRPAEGEHNSLEEAFQLAFHLRAAREHDALVHVLPDLLPRLLRGGQPQRVHALSLWGLEAIDALPKSQELDRLRVSLLESAVDAADRLGFRKGQRELLDRLTDLDFDPALDPETVGRVYLLHGRYAVSTGQYGLARGMLRNAVEMFERSGKKLEASESVRRLSLVQGHVGELEDARKLARQAISTSQHDAQRALAHLALGTVDILEDQFEPALKNSDRALQLLRGAPNFHLPGAYAAAYMLRARVYRASGSPGRALASASRAVELARIAGERRLEAEATARLGGMLLDVDRADEAEARLREALRMSEEIEDRRGQALARLFLGILLWEAHDPEAAPMLARTSQLAVEMGLNRVEAVSLSLQARILRERGEIQTALDASSRAMTLLSQYGAELGDRIVITGTHALVLENLGERAESQALERKLTDRLRRDNARIKSPLLRLRQARASTRLLEAVLSPDGPVYPRLRETE